MKKIYLDYAATTPVDPRVFTAMKPYFSDRFGNAGSLHSFGQEAMAALDDSREKVAKVINADFREIIFTGSATEANNLAILGVAKSLSKNIDRKTRKVIVSSVEHESVLETARGLAALGIQMVYLPVDKNGLVQLTALRENLDERVILVSVMYANNEIGTIQPIFEIAEIIKNFKKESDTFKRIGAGLEDKKPGGYPLFHTDAAQAFQYLDCDVKKLGVDLMTLSAHKIYGPKGVGALYVSDDCKIARLQDLKINDENKKKNHAISNLQLAINPILTGGGQEYGLRSGTENIPGIVGFAKAVELVSNSRELENKRIKELRDYLWKELKKLFPKAEINGINVDKNRERVDVRLPNNLNIYFPGHKAEDLLIKFDLAGIAVSAGSACSARGTELSRVLKACGFLDERIKSSLRITLGKPTTKAEVREAIKRVKKLL